MRPICAALVLNPLLVEWGGVQEYNRFPFSGEKAKIMPCVWAIPCRLVWDFLYNVLLESNTRCWHRTHLNPHGPVRRQRGECFVRGVAQAVG